MSEYTRRKNAGTNQLVACCTCGKSIHWKELHAGHYLHGGRGGKGNAVSYDHRNINPQCPGCNYFGARGEAALNYSQFMFRKYGSGILDELKAIKAQSKMRRPDFEDKIAELEKKLKLLDL